MEYLNHESLGCLQITYLFFLFTFSTCVNLDELFEWGHVTLFPPSSEFPSSRNRYFFLFPSPIPLPHFFLSIDHGPDSLEGRSSERAP